MKYIVKFKKYDRYYGSEICNWDTLETCIYKGIVKHGIEAQINQFQKILEILIKEAIIKNPECFEELAQTLNFENEYGHMLSAVDTYPN